MKIAKIFGKRPVVNIKTESFPGEKTFKELSSAKHKIRRWAKKNNISKVEIDNFQKEYNQVEFDDNTINTFFSEHIKIKLEEISNKKYELCMKFPFENPKSFVSKLFETLNNYKTDHVITTIKNKA